MRIKPFGIVTGVIGILGIIVADYLTQPFASPILYVGSAILVGFALKNIEERFVYHVPHYQYIGYGGGRYAMGYAGMTDREEWKSIFGTWAYVFTALFLVCKLLFWISLGWFFLKG